MKGLVRTEGAKCSYCVQKIKYSNHANSLQWQLFYFSTKFSS